MPLTGDLEEKILENIIEVANEIEDDVDEGQRPPSRQLVAVLRPGIYIF